MKTLNFLLEITIYSGILFCAIMLLKWCFKNRMSPFLHFVIWGLLIARLLIPVTLESAVHLFVIPNETQNAVVQEQVQSPVSNDTALNIDTSSVTQSTRQTSSNQQAQDAATSAAKQSLVLSTQDIVLAIWLTGASTGLLYLVILYSALRKRIRRNAEPPSERLLGLFEEVKTELNIKRNVIIIGQCEYGAPAVLFPNTVLIPINTLVSMSDDEVKFVLRHELMHFKRGDHILSLALSILNAIYWFNPIVWIAFKQMRADMETACDSDVVRRFSSNERSTYAAIILSLFSKKQYGNLVLGMVQGNTRKIAEKRIRGVFMNNKSNRKVKITAILLTSLLLFTCFTTACQPTPENSIVVGKDMQAMLSKAKSYQDPKGSLKERLDVPDKLQTSVQSENGKFKTTVDANIVLPDVNSIPIVRVEGQSFDQQTVEKIKGIFFDNGKCYDPDALSEETKTELIDVLAQLKQRKSELEQQGMKPLHPELESDTENNTQDATNGMDNGVSDETANMSAFNSLDMVNDSIAAIEKKLPTALDQRKLVEVPSDLKQIDEESQLERLYAAQLNPTGGMHTLTVNSDGQMSTLDYVNRKDYDPFHGFYYSEDEWNQFQTQNPNSSAADTEAAKSLQYPPMTMGQAQEVADDFLRHVGIQDFVCERNEKVIGGSGQTWGDDSVRRGNLLKAYQLQYVRTVGGAPVTYTDVDVASGGEGNEVNPWYYERITFIIDDSGIVEFQWYAPYRILDTVVDNTSMLSFPQIEDIFKKKIVTINDWMDVAGIDMNITDVRLGLMRVTEQNNINQGLLIPVWDFFGTFTQYTDQDGKRYTEPFNGTTRSLLTINAIDGAIIDRGLGY